MLILFLLFLNSLHIVAFGENHRKKYEWNEAWNSVDILFIWEFWLFCARMSRATFFPHQLFNFLFAFICEKFHGNSEIENINNDHSLNWAISLFFAVCFVIHENFMFNSLRPSIRGNMQKNDKRNKTNEQNSENMKTAWCPCYECETFSTWKQCEKKSKMHIKKMSKV